MSAFDRRTAILTYLQQHRRASTRQLSDLFGVSEVTIRTDFATLEESGYLSRQHGGVELRRAQDEQPFEARRSQHPYDKVEVARAAAATIEAGDTVILDASSTAYQLTLTIKDRRTLTVVTNNVQTAAALAGNPALGGRADRRPGARGQLERGRRAGGGHAEQAARHTRLLRRGRLDPRPRPDRRRISREVQFERAMIAAAKEVTVLLDASKFGQQSFLTFAKLTDIDHLVTDDGVPEEYREACRQHGYPPDHSITSEFRKFGSLRLNSIELLDLSRISHPT